MKTVLRSCIGTDTNISNPNLLYHFIDHYKALGITNWALTLHASLKKELNNLEVFADILTQWDIAYEVWIDEYNTHKREDRDNIFVQQQEDSTWIFGVDLDEFVDFPCPIPEYLASLSEQNYNCLSGRLIDRVDAEGNLRSIEKTPDISDQFPRIAAVKKNIYQPQAGPPAFGKKLAIQKPLKWWVGRHTIHPETLEHVREAPTVLTINHYAWDRLLIGRITQRAEVYRQRQNLGWFHEYINMIEYIQKYGKLRLEDILEDSKNV